MKKIAIFLLSAICFITTAAADNYKPVPVEKLPAKAQSFLNSHFKNVKVSLSRQELDVFELTYDVIFTDGRKVEFNHKGEWTEVDCNAQAVPAGIVPKAIVDYVNAHYPGTTINQIERDHKEVEVKLNNRIELTFNKKMQLIDVD